MSGTDGRDKAAPDAASDEIEHWLHELRTDLRVDPPGWLAEQAEQPDQRAADSPPATPSARGRHWARD